MRGDRLDRGQVVRGERDLGRGDVLLQVAAPLGAGNGDRALVLDPGEGQLGGRDVLVGGDAADLADDVQVAVEVLALEPGSVRRQSSSAKSSGLVIAPDRKPRPSGE